RRHTRCYRDWSSDVCSSDLHHGYPRASRLTNGKASKGQIGTQSLGCAGQTVRPSLHSTSQTSAGKLSVLSYSVSVLMFDVRGIKIGRASCRERVEDWGVEGR